MLPSILRTVGAVPVVAAGVGPSQVVQPRQVPLRVLLRSFGGITFAGFSDSDFALPLASASGLYLVAAGAADVIVLAPDQELLIGAVVGGVSASIAISEAYPVGLGR